MFGCRRDRNVTAPLLDTLIKDGWSPLALPKSGLVPGSVLIEHQDGQDGATRLFSGEISTFFDLPAVGRALAIRRSGIQRVASLQRKRSGEIEGKAGLAALEALGVGIAGKIGVDARWITQVEVQLENAWSDMVNFDDLNVVLRDATAISSIYDVVGARRFILAGVLLSDCFSITIKGGSAGGVNLKSASPGSIASVDGKITIEVENANTMLVKSKEKLCIAVMLMEVHSDHHGKVKLKWKSSPGANLGEGDSKFEPAFAGNPKTGSHFIDIVNAEVSPTDERLS